MACQPLMACGARLDGNVAVVIDSLHGNDYRSRATRGPPLSTRYFSIRTARNAHAAIFSVSLQGETEARGGAKRLDAFRDDADCGGCWLILYVHEVN